MVVNWVFLYKLIFMFIVCWRIIICDIGLKNMICFFMEKNIKDIGFLFFFFWNLNVKYF